MKKYIALIALLVGIAHAETITLPTPLNVGGQITAIEVSDVVYRPEDNSWRIIARPVVTYPQPQQTEDLSVGVLISVQMAITVRRSEIESALGISDVGNATVDQLNSTVRSIAMSKALAALTP